jgi:tetratricopeptide (TPR) repeat protein
MLAMLLLLIAVPVIAGEPDWFTRVKEQGIEKASEVEVGRHAKGILKDSLHVGECYYHLGRWAEGKEVFAKLLRSPDRNYAASALARVGEGHFHLGEKEEARKVFVRCMAEHPEAWLDGSVPEFCRAWLLKLDGKLESPEKAMKEEKPELEEVKKEIDELSERLAKLKKLLKELTEEEE